MLRVHPDPCLKQVCTPVTEFNDELKTLAKQMRDVMVEEVGIGLAANQIGVMKRVVVTYYPGPTEGEEPRAWHGKEMVFINPVITHRDGTQINVEGCLSFPDITAKIKRSAKVLVKYQGLEGKPEGIWLDGYFAVCLQHEIDHLDGITMIDRTVRLPFMIP